MGSRVALVTGSATGIGRATALLLAQRGLAVAVNYSRSENEAKETLEQVKRQGVAAILCRCNVADEPQVRDMFRRCREELGGLDVLVNNAGTTRAGKRHKTGGHRCPNLRRISNPSYIFRKAV